MAWQDPLLFAVTLIVFPPAMLLLRKMIRRIRHISRAQFTGGTRILETMQETLQGMRIVKAFTLEDELRRALRRQRRAGRARGEQDGRASPTAPAR